MQNFIISAFSSEINEDFDAKFQNLRELGIKYFEPTGFYGKNIEDLTDDEVFKLLTLMKKHGIRASAIASNIGKIGIRDDFETHFEKFKRVIEIAKALGTEYVRIFSFFIPENCDAELFFGELTLRLVKMIMYAKSQNIVLLHENAKGTYGDTLNHCFRLFDALYSSNFKAIFNFGNFAECNEDIKQTFQKLYPYIAYMRIDDTKYISNNLNEKDYFGFLSFESPENNLASAYASLKTILEKL